MAVTNFTATSIGDYMFARLQEPYIGTSRIIGWNILAGVNSPNSVGTLKLVEGSTELVGTGLNLNLVTGNQFIVGSQIFVVESISFNIITTTVAATFSAEAATWYEFPDNDNYFTYGFSYSQSAIGTDGGQMSEIRELNNSIGPRDILGLVLDPNTPLWIDIKAEVHRLSSLHTLSLLSVTFEIETEAGTIQSCPNLCADCTDPYLAGCTNIVIDCVDPVWDPYSLSKPTAMYTEISELAANMWGHPVQYFRVEPDQRSRDVILMEYSLYNVKEQGDLKVIVPDNEMPTREFQYDIFGMGFEDFEIHITKGQMEAAFGLGKHPRPRDYMYIPVMNRMYEVSSVSFADEFNQAMTYWKVMLKKYEERSSTIVEDGSALETQLDDLYTGVEEVFGAEIQDEYVQSTKPEQYQTIYSEVGDGIRDRIHNTLTISDKEIRNKWTILAKNHYNLETVKDLGIECLVYKKHSQLQVSDNLAFSAWVKPNLTSASAEQVIFDGHFNNKGFKLTMNQTHIKAYVNDLVLDYPFTIAPVNGNWYGVVYNLNNIHLNTTASVYKLNPDSNKLTSMAISDTLIEVLDQNFEIPNPEGWVTSKKWSLMPGKLSMTNIRLYSKVISKEQHTNMLQQYIVRDNRLCHIIDNAVPSIQLRKYNQGR